MTREEIAAQATDVAEMVENYYWTRGRAQEQQDKLVIENMCWHFTHELMGYEGPLFTQRKRSVVAMAKKILAGKAPRVRLVQPEPAPAPSGFRHAADGHYRPGTIWFGTKAEAAARIASLTAGHGERFVPVRRNDGRTYEIAIYAGVERIGMV